MKIEWHSTPLPDQLTQPAGARLRRQVSYVSRAITAEEYNAAVARAPGDCPLFAAGDLRSGRQVCSSCEGGYVERA